MIPNKLHEFYREWYEAADGTIETTWFSPSSGLCQNLEKYCVARGWDILICHDLLSIMEQQFKDAGLDREFPFNGGSHTSYRIENQTKSMHKNEKRLAFVKSKLLELVLR